MDNNNFQNNGAHDQNQNNASNDFGTYHDGINNPTDDEKYQKLMAQYKEIEDVLNYYRPTQNRRVSFGDAPITNNGDFAPAQHGRGGSVGRGGGRGGGYGDGGQGGLEQHNVERGPAHHESGTEAEPRRR